MKFNREINNESGRAFSWFFSVFSLLLMALALWRGMPWYGCFFFIAFTLLCVNSIIDLQPCRFRDGEILYFRHCIRRRAKIADANILLLTEYSGPLRRNGAKTYEVKVRPGEKAKRSRMYIMLLKIDDVALLGKSVNSSTAKIYYKKKIVFSMMYQKEVLAETIKGGFSGEIYVFRKLYDSYREDFDAIAAETGFDYSRVLVMG